MIVARYISGKFALTRRIVRVSLLVLYLVVPWISYSTSEGDRPALLFDIAARKFYFPGAVFWPQEFYFLWFLLATLGLSLFLFTSLFGRLWCGWACPQTVYTEMFDAVGRWISPRYGKASQKTYEKVLVHGVWVLLAAILTFHFVGYFVGVREMGGALLSVFSDFSFAALTDVSWPYFWLAATGLFYFDLGIFRHNFCVYICPYARFQSVMLDRDSLTIAYDRHRGEPRQHGKPLARSDAFSLAEANASGGARTGNTVRGTGDCTGCTKCVQVCPTGIDIREGLQVACINCAHCVDACTDEMAKFGKETLVGYHSLGYFEERRAPRLIRPRTVTYAALLLAVVGGLSAILWMRTPFQVSVVRDRHLAPVVLDNQVQNYYTLDLINMRESPVSYRLSVEGDSPTAEFSGIFGENPIRLRPLEHRPLRVIVRMRLPANERELATGTRSNQPIRFVVSDLSAENAPGKRSTGTSEYRSMFTIPATQSRSAKAPERTP